MEADGHMHGDSALTWSARNFFECTEERIAGIDEDSALTRSARNFFTMPARRTEERIAALMKTLRRLGPREISSTCRLPNNLSILYGDGKIL